MFCVFELEESVCLCVRHYEKLRQSNKTSCRFPQISVRHPEKEWSGLLPEIQKLQEEKERLKDACSKGQRTAEKLAKENYSSHNHNETQGW